MISRTHAPAFLKKTAPAKPATPTTRMKSSRREAIGADTSEAIEPTRRSFLPKPKRAR